MARKKRKEEYDDYVVYREEENDTPIPLKIKLVFIGLFLLLAVGIGLFVFKDRIFPPTVYKTIEVNKTEGKEFYQYKLPEQASKIIINETSIWAIIPQTKQLVEINKQNGEIVRTPISLPFKPLNLKEFRGGIWVTGGVGILRVDIATRDISKELSTGNEPVDLLAVGPNLWVLNRGDDTISRIATVSGKASTYNIEPGAFALTKKPESSRYFWIAYGNIDQTISLAPGISIFDVKSRKADENQIIRQGFNSFVGTEKFLWTAHTADKGLLKFDITTGKDSSDRVIRLSASPTQLKYTNNKLYVVLEGNPYRIAQLTPDTAVIEKETALDEKPVLDYQVDTQGNYWFIRKDSKTLDKHQECSAQNPCKIKQTVEE